MTMDISEPGHRVDYPIAGIYGEGVDSLGLMVSSALHWDAIWTIDLRGRVKNTTTASGRGS